MCSPPTAQRGALRSQPAWRAVGGPDRSSLAGTQLPTLLHRKPHGGLETRLHEDRHRDFAWLSGLSFLLRRDGHESTCRGAERFVGRSCARAWSDTVQHTCLSADASHARTHRQVYRVLEILDVFLVDGQHQFLVILVAEGHEFLTGRRVRAEQLLEMGCEDLPMHGATIVK